MLNTKANPNETTDLGWKGYVDAGPPIGRSTNCNRCPAGCWKWGGCVCVGAESTWELYFLLSLAVNLKLL